MVTLLDVAPTIADLIGLREANPWQGHSLLAVAPGPARSGSASAIRCSPRRAAGARCAIGQDGRARLYDARTDWLQRRDVAAQRPALARRLLEQADGHRRFNDWLIRHGRVWPREGG